MRILLRCWSMLRFSQRSIRLAIHLLRLICVFKFLIHTQPARIRYMQRWSAKFLKICGIRLNLVHDQTWKMPFIKPTVVLSNHISWADIFALYTLVPIQFVARKEVREWFVVGKLCEQLGCLFIDREKRRAVYELNLSMKVQLNQGATMSFFPEAKTTDGFKILPFHANLFQPLIETQATILPCVFQYLDHDHAVSIAPSIQDERTMYQSLTETLKLPYLTLGITCLAPIDVNPDHTRQTICLQTEQAIRAAFISKMSSVSNKG